jgi:hypothetical protein
MGKYKKVKNFTSINTDALSAKTKVRDRLQRSVKEPLKASLPLGGGAFFVRQPQRL